MRYHRRRTQPTRWLGVSGLIVLICIVFLNQRFAHSGLATPFAALFAAFEIPINVVSSATAWAGSSIIAVPGLASENARLRGENARLSQRLAQLQEQSATAERDRAISSLTSIYAKSIVADCIGYDPENVRRTITIDQGSLAGVARDAGVINEDGVVGRVLLVTPLSSTVLLLDSYASNIPAIVQHGRYWGIARGSLARVRLDDVALDAALKLGDLVVTGRGRSFPAGVPIGNIIAISRSDAALTQTAVVAPNVDFARLERVVVLPHLDP